MAQCVKYPSLEGQSTVLPGNFETTLSYKGRNLWMEYIRPQAAWSQWRKAEQKLYAVQLRQSSTNTDLGTQLTDAEYWFRKAEEAMFDLAKAWIALGAA